MVGTELKPPVVCLSQSDGFSEFSAQPASFLTVHALLQTHLQPLDQHRT